MQLGSTSLGLDPNCTKVPLCETCITGIKARFKRERGRKSETNFVHFKFNFSDILNGILLVAISYFLMKICLCGAVGTKIKTGDAVSVVSFAAVIRAVMQCSSSLTAAHSSSAFLSLCY